LLTPGKSSKLEPALPTVGRRSSCP
jgi:hypothetical protein